MRTVIEVDLAAMVVVPSVTVMLIGTLEPTVRVFGDFTVATKVPLAGS